MKTFLRWTLLLAISIFMVAGMSMPGMAGNNNGPIADRAEITSEPPVFGAAARQMVRYPATAKAPDAQRSLSLSGSPGNILGEQVLGGEERALGDIGLPADYIDTLRDFSEEYPNLPTLLEQFDPAFDWRTLGAVTTAKDQGNCGSCWAFAAVGSLESKILISGDPAYDLSEQQVVSCNAWGYDCCGGSMTVLNFWNAQGPMQEACTGYGDYTTGCPPGSNVACSSMDACLKFDYNTTGYYTVDTADTNEVKASLVNDGPTYFRYNVYSDFNTFWSTAAPGVVYLNTGGAFQGGHAVLIIGWDDAKSAWLLKNSWGATGGPNGDGTFWMAYAGHLNNLQFGMANAQLGAAPPAPFAKEFEINVEGPTGDIRCLGVEFDGVNYWITGAGSDWVNKLYKVSPAGVLLDTYLQGTTGDWGWRDLAFDDTFLYASSSSLVQQIDPATGLATGVTIPGPQNPNRGLAYDPATDHFWTANFGSSIYEFDRTGTVINQYPNTLGIYGLAWDPYSPGGPWLWVWSQDGNGCLLSQFDPSTGTYTGVTYDGAVPPGGVAGGATLQSDGIFVGLHQAEPDTIVGYRLFEAGCQPLNDGGFENGPPPASAWTEWSNHGCGSLIGNWDFIFGIPPYEGSYEYWAGGYCGSPMSGYVEQAVAVPAGASTLNFMANYYRPDPDDVDSDTFYVHVDGTPVFSKAMIQANNTYPDWIEESVDISSYAGQTVTIRFGADSVGSQTGNVLIDDIRTCGGAVPCTFTIDPDDVVVGYCSGASGNTVEVAVTASGSGCAWTVVNDLPWVSVSPMSGTGSGTVTVSLAANEGYSRSGAITIAGQTFSIEQLSNYDFNGDGCFLYDDYRYYLINFQKNRNKPASAFPELDLNCDGWINDQDLILFHGLVRKYYGKCQPQ